MNEQNYLDFENYLANEMSNDEKISFEKKLQSDNELNAEFENYKTTSRFLETKFSNQTADFKSNLKSISSQHFAEKSTSNGKVISMYAKYFAIAASLFLVFGLYQMLRNDQPNYQDFSGHETATFVERGEIIKDLKTAQHLFNEKKYQEAIPLFETILKTYDKPEVNYFYAICLIETDNFLKAEDVLLKLKDGKSLYKNRATWYLALMRLKQKNYDSCKNFLKQIPEDAEDYAKAKELLELL